MTTKESLLELAEVVLKRLPDDATLREFIDELEVMEAVEEGLADARAGRVISLDELKRRTELCLSK